MTKIHIEKTLNAERQHVFDVMANYANYDKTMPRYFPSIKVRSVREDVAVVEEHMNLGDRKLVMMTKHVTKYPELHEVYVIGGNAKGTRIVERYEKTPQGTRVIIDAEIRLGRLASIIPKKTASDFDEMIAEFAKIAES